MPGFGLVIAIGRGLLTIVAWMGRALAGQKAMLWVRVFIIGLFLSQIATYAVGFYVVRYIVERFDTQGGNLVSLIDKLDILKSTRDGQLAAMAATDLRLTHEQGELKAEEAGLREQVKAIRVDMAEIKVSLRDLTRHVLLRDHAEATPNPAWPPAIRDKP